MSTYLLTYWLQEGEFPDELWHLIVGSPNRKPGYVKDATKLGYFYVSILYALFFVLFFFFSKLVVLGDNQNRRSIYLKNFAGCRHYTLKN